MTNEHGKFDDSARGANPDLNLSVAASQLALQEVQTTQMAGNRLPTTSQSSADSLSFGNIYADTANPNLSLNKYLLNSVDDSDSTQQKLEQQSDSLAGTASVSVDRLAGKYPDAGLPAKMTGTTIDADVMYKLNISHPPSAQDQQNLDDYADAVMSKAQGMNLNTVRLGAYWDQIMKDPNNPNYAELDAFMQAAQNHGLKVVLTVGEKAPGYPEYYFPQYKPGQSHSGSAGLPPTSSHNVVNFVKDVSDHIASETTTGGAPGIGNAVAMWQVENEPYDASGKDNYWLSPDQVNQEIATLRASDNGRRPIMETFWSDNRQVQRLNQAFANPNVDVVGIDVYSRTGDEPQNSADSSADKIRTQDIPQYVENLARASGKPAMIAELQADPWGGTNGNHQNDFNPTSDTVNSLYNQEQSNGFSDVLFWRLDANLNADNHIDAPNLSAAQIIDRIRNPLNYDYSESGITQAERQIAQTDSGA